MDLLIGLTTNATGGKGAVGCRVRARQTHVSNDVTGCSTRIQHELKDKGMVYVTEKIHNKSLTARGGEGGEGGGVGGLGGGVGGFGAFGGEGVPVQETEKFCMGPNRRLSHLKII